MTKKFNIKGMLAGAAILLGLVCANYKSDRVANEKSVATAIPKVARPLSKNKTNREPASKPEKLIGNAGEFLKSARAQIETRQEFRQDVDYLKKMGQALGEDLVAKLTIQTLYQAILAKQGEPLNDLVIDCRRQAKCPVSIQTFYRQALSRLPAAEFAQMKDLLQEQMLESELPQAEKEGLLSLELTATDFTQLLPTVVNEQVGEIILRDDAIYLLKTQERLLNMSTDPQLAVNSSFDVIERSQDPAVNLLFAANLVRKYPQDFEALTAELEQSGVATEDLIELLFSPQK